MGKRGRPTKIEQRLRAITPLDAEAHRRAAVNVGDFHIVVAPGQPLVNSSSSFPIEHTPVQLPIETVLNKTTDITAFKTSVNQLIQHVSRSPSAADQHVKDACVDFFKFNGMHAKCKTFETIASELGTSAMYVQRVLRRVACAATISEMNTHAKHQVVDL